ncbi:ribonuclease H domain protein [Prevotella sp. DNF00663]|uniref:DUF559 domain-containing protein n=1 Tax=unclassified Prevotella TaxID=2638335 RepID=UPI000513060A|nr:MULTISPECIES: DUF559 domain-containing protein [unclassified Prevotella]KGI59529.1 hypothetical protein HMPREF0671_11135 [Prevotella sp. S7 MS 2]KXB82771.1 ribonuclease H domain protein [Prevotella sp. DNF00663]
MYIYETAESSEYELLKKFAEENRLCATEAERILWTALRGKQLDTYKFRRQHIIGEYIADFVCLHDKLVIEVDGVYHERGLQPMHDRERTEFLNSKGFKVIRFKNEDIIANINGVINSIRTELTLLKNNKMQTSISAPVLSKEAKIANPLQNNTPSPFGEGRGGAAIAVDAACSGNPGPMEYQGIDLQTGTQIFHFGPVHGTNNIGEFLAIVHALALLDKKGITGYTIYSDSYNAILWVKKKQCKTKLERNAQTEPLFQIIARAELWLRTHRVTTPVVKWETKQWGEIPADFGRK